jgi:CRISPR-associated exonuclease Cas4
MLPIEDDYLPISALNDLLFCERRCAMHRIEQVWVENRFTIEGTGEHRRVHTDGDVLCEQGRRREVRGMVLRSDRLRLVGKADLVQFSPEPFLIEYKRGKKRRWDNDDVQLCAQALCLEEMIGVPIPTGAVYHIRSKRRREIVFDEFLREKTMRTAQRLHELIESGVTPPPIPKPRCKGCSLERLCMPRTLADARQATLYASRLYSIDSESNE